MSFRWLACWKLFCAPAQFSFFSNSCVIPPCLAFQVALWNSTTSESSTLCSLLLTLENIRKASCHSFPHSMLPAACLAARRPVTTEMPHLWTHPTRPRTSTEKKIPFKKSGPKCVYFFLGVPTYAIANSFVSQKKPKMSQSRKESTKWAIICGFCIPFFISIIQFKIIAVNTHINVKYNSI